MSVESGPVAQRLEQWTHNPLVVGSNPTGPTRYAFIAYPPVPAVPPLLSCPPPQTTTSYGLWTGSSRQKEKAFVLSSAAPDDGDAAAPAAAAPAIARKRRRLRVSGFMIHLSFSLRRINNSTRVATVDDGIGLHAKLAGHVVFLGNDVIVHQSLFKTKRIELGILKSKPELYRFSFQLG